ncbi:unnamed protein product [Chondrus crispus]|uniref:Double-strand break repair protein n=1 Tax=Chondrus crispus TaxID=2769 RepID=R7Q9I6_CHOCR|nr:unnamed protein product [Chondrus crispus]CDF35202.1 unnamed protein product [Chondrus crispus]|eukprot:XP_005715021.1 unnamed protein product [Chondrus crispus]
MTHPYSEGYDEPTKILLSSDNHLGYLENDPLRHDDSFRTFEELLYIARSNSVDFIVLSGNLFHHRQPSNATLQRTIKLLREYCLSLDRRSSLHVISDPRAVHFKDPRNPVAIPVFVLHGDRDSPGKGHGTKALSPLDVLAESGLITYFGKTGSDNPLEISPILLEKGGNAIALYGLGHMRGEKLLKASQKDNGLSWMRPKIERKNGQIDLLAYPHRSPAMEHNPDSRIDDNWFNIFAFHQNRDMEHPSTQAVHHIADGPRGVSESFLPDWMDCVVWGHENGRPLECTSSKIYLVQPGSTVATSLSEAQAKPKHVVLMEVGLEHTYPQEIELHTVRDMHFERIPSPSSSEAYSVFMDQKLDEVIRRREVQHQKKMRNFKKVLAQQSVKNIVYPSEKFYEMALYGLGQRPLVRIIFEKTDGREPRSSGQMRRKYAPRVAAMHELFSVERTHSDSEAGMGVQARDVSLAQGESMRLMQNLSNYFTFHSAVGGEGLSCLRADQVNNTMDEALKGGKQVKLWEDVKEQIANIEVTVADEKLNALALGERIDKNELRESLRKKSQQATMRMLRNSRRRAGLYVRTEATVSNSQTDGLEDEDEIQPVQDRDDESFDQYLTHAHEVVMRQNLIPHDGLEDEDEIQPVQDRDDESFDQYLTHAHEEDMRQNSIPHGTRAFSVGGTSATRRKRTGTPQRSPKRAKRSSPARTPRERFGDIESRLNNQASKEEDEIMPAPAIAQGATTR